jgi:DNA-binding CsgD family transcriptional regulator
MRLLVPHLRRAILICKMIDLRKVEATSLSAAMDGLAAGVFLVDRSGRIVYANTAGHRLLGQGVMLRSPQGRLTASDPLADHGLRDVITAAKHGDMQVGAKGVAVPLTDPQGDQWLVHVLPLTCGERQEAAIVHAASAAVFVRRACLDAPSAMETVAKLYKLTPSELRVLLAVVEVGGTSEVAEALGIAVTTVKTHLQHLYEKTGAGRQADLVKLVAGFANPLVS